MTAQTTPTGGAAARQCSPAARITRSLLGYGVIAGPFYVTVSLAQALTRDGFRLDRHAWSLLENGSLGWIQITNLIVTGLMTVAAAVGLRRAMTAGRGRRWAPSLIAGYGAGMLGGAVFTADPAQGFPLGTPEVTPVSWHGMLHLVTGGIGFLCLIAACLVLGSRFAGAGRPGLAWFSRLTGVAFLAAFAGIAGGSHGPATLAFVAAILLVWAWLAIVCVHFSRAAS
ncbi:hypothetical protein Aph02nite_44880 [Actinoplanes philippinensis]|uniref:Hypothetical membrane protein n=1 Tax=Actinoplanes philippinensis TaxID=35752 RepID=A0A1I2I758_9ACTN|nr:DUF998 domain-containing protein [Actinoplanes philippinensis]GIE78538.1 hypothetical protein Aph02nite_44880 [Actinoplanes philippinensis]SFF38155.1 hypothetical membrane protein [Actinoplanes philippinensis]